MRPKWYAHLREGHLVTCNCCPWLYDQTCTSGVELDAPNFLSAVNCI